MRSANGASAGGVAVDVDGGAPNSDGCVSLERAMRHRSTPARI
jgi:hypothetical protein